MADFGTLRKELEDFISHKQWHESSDCIHNILSIVEEYKSQYSDLEEKVNMLLCNITDAIWSIDIHNLQFTYISPSIKKVCGYTADDIIQHSETNPFYLKIRKIFSKVLNDRLKFFNEDPNYNEVFSDEIELKALSGNKIWLEIISSFYFNSKTKKIELIGNTRNITDKKNAQLALKQARERFKILTDITLEGLIIHDNKKIIDANPALERMFGEDLDAIIGSSLYNYIHPDYIPKIKERIKLKLTGKYETMLMRKDETTFPAEIEASYMEIKNRTYRVAAVRDITERKNAEEKIRKFTSAITQSPSAIVITDLNGRIEYINPQFTKITGYTPDEAIGKNPNILKSGFLPQSVYKDLWNTILMGEIWKGELLNTRKDGTLFWENAVIAPIKNESGIVTNFIAIKDDITAKKEAEQELIRSKEELKQANATKDKFFSIIAHDLKNPFNIILGFSDLLLLNHKEYDEETREGVIKTIYDMALKTFNLLENLLAWSRTQTGIIAYNPKEIDLQTLINDCILLFKENAEKKQIKLYSKIDEDIVAYADRDMIATVLRNLIINGIKFTPRMGQVSVYASKTLDNQVQISVKDTGIGIKSEKIPVIFDIDRNWSQSGTEEETGTGLGLFLCKEFIEKNNGEIWLESEINEGTTFHIKIPMTFINTED